MLGPLLQKFLICIKFFCGVFFDQTGHHTKLVLFYQLIPQFIEIRETLDNLSSILSLFNYKTIGNLLSQ